MAARDIAEHELAIYLRRMVKAVPEMEPAKKKAFARELKAIPEPSRRKLLLLAWSHLSRRQRIALLAAAFSMVEMTIGYNARSPTIMVRVLCERAFNLVLRYYDSQAYTQLLATAAGGLFGAGSLWAGIPPSIGTGFATNAVAWLAPGQGPTERVLQRIAPGMKSAAGSSPGKELARAFLGVTKVFLEALVIGTIVREGVFGTGQAAMEAGSYVLYEADLSSLPSAGFNDLSGRFYEDAWGEDGKYDTRTFPLGLNVGLVNTDRNVTDAIHDFLRSKLNEAKSFNGQSAPYQAYSMAESLAAPRVLTTGKDATVVLNQLQTLKTGEGTTGALSNAFKLSLPERFPKQGITDALLSVQKFNPKSGANYKGWTSVSRKDTLEGIVSGGTEDLSQPTDAKSKYTTIEDVGAVDDLRLRGHFIYDKGFIQNFPAGFKGQNMLQKVYYTTTDPAKFDIPIEGARQSLANNLKNTFGYHRAEASLFTARPGIVKIGALTITSTDGGVTATDQEIGAAYLNTYFEVRPPRVPGGEVSAPTRFNNETNRYARVGIALLGAFGAYRFGLALCHRPNRDRCPVYVADDAQGNMFSSQIVCDREMAAAYNNIFTARESLDPGIAGDAAAQFVISQVRPQTVQRDGKPATVGNTATLRKILDIDDTKSAQLITGSAECIFRQKIAWETGNPSLIALAYEQARSPTEDEERLKPRPCMFAGVKYCAENGLDPLVSPADEGKGVSAFCQSGGIWFPYTDDMTSDQQETQFCHTACLVKHVNAQLAIDIAASKGVDDIASTLLRIIVGMDRKERIREEPYVHFFSGLLDDATRFARTFKELEAQKTPDRKATEYWNNLILAFIEKRAAYVCVATGGTAT